MATPLEKTLKRELSLDGREFIVAISPDGIKLTLKGKRNGQELKWRDWVSGDAALARALNASIGGFVQPTQKPPVPEPPVVTKQLTAAKPAAAAKKAAQRTRSRRSR